MKALALRLITSLEKKERVDSCSSMDKGKRLVIDDVDETRDDIDPEDAEYILEEDDLVIIDEIRACYYSKIL